MRRAREGWNSLGVMVLLLLLMLLLMLAPTLVLAGCCCCLRHFALYYIMGLSLGGVERFFVAVCVSYLSWVRSVRLIVVRGMNCFVVGF